MPESTRRLETRFLVKNTEGVYGLTYRWNLDQTEADLVPESGLDEIIPLYEDGSLQLRMWRYPSRGECLACHTRVAGLALGFDTLQLNRQHNFGTIVTSQLLGLSRMGYFQEPLQEVSDLQRHAAPDDVSATVQDRVRSYVAVNCVQCHQPGGAARGLWDARFTTPLADAGIIHGPLINNAGDAAQRVITPGSLDTSMLLTRIRLLGSAHMPPLATFRLNQPAIDLLTTWISSDLAPEFRDPSIGSQGDLALEFTGLPNQNYRVEFSPDLANWQFLVNAATDADGRGRAADLDSGQQTSRYYRLLLP